jgi:hypothetical protein
MTTALVVLSATLLASLAIALPLWHRGPWLIALALTVLLVLGGVVLKRLDGGVGSWLSYSVFLALPVVSAIALLFGLSRQRRPSALHVFLAVGLAILLMPFAVSLSVVWDGGL